MASGGKRGSEPTPVVYRISFNVLKHCLSVARLSEGIADEQWLEIRGRRNRHYQLHVRGSIGTFANHTDVSSAEGKLSRARYGAAEGE